MSTILFYWTILSDCMEKIDDKHAANVESVGGWFVPLVVETLVLGVWTLKTDSDWARTTVAYLREFFYSNCLCT